MNLSQLIQSLGCRVIVEPPAEVQVSAAYTSDLLSDIMGNAEDYAVLITIQAHKNTIAVAMQLESPAVILCNNRPVGSDVQEAARSAGIAVLQTDADQFTVSGKLYALLHA